jgi:DNA-directed RNA polymerase specialized sigma24 family protein
VATTDVPWSTGADFVGFAHREQEDLLRIALLVDGDSDRARRLVEDALVAVGRRWTQFVEEDPHLEVRRTLYRSAVASAESAASPGYAGSAGSAGSGDAPVAVVGDEDTAESRALARLSPRRRALLAARCLDGRTERETARLLRMGVRRVRAETDGAVADLAAALPGHRLGHGGVGDPGLTRLLRAVPAELPEIDVVDSAALRARAEHRAIRRRGVLAAGGVVAAGALTTALVRRAGEPPAPVPVPTGDPRLPSTTLDGVPVQLAPDLRDEAALPTHRSPSSLGVPDSLGPGDPTRLLALPPGGLVAPVSTVYLVHDERGRFLPVLQLEGEVPRTRSVPRAAFSGLETSTTVVGPRTIADDRARLVFPAPSLVVVVDVATGSVSQVPVPDPTLRVAGWAHDGRTVVAQGPRGREDGWLVDPAAGVVHSATGFVHSGRAELTWTGGVTGVRSFADDGTIVGWREVPGPRVVPYGVSASDDRGWVAAPAYLPGPYQEDLGRGQGVVAVPPEGGGPPRVLAAEVPVGSTEDRYRVLAWAPGGVVVVESRSPAGPTGGPLRRVLGWDVEGGRLWRLGEVTGVGSPGGSWFTGQWAL